MIRAICIGEPMVEMRAASPETLSRAVAGDAYNTAVYLRRCLAAPDEVSLLTVIGRDRLSADLMADFEHQGVATSQVYIQPDRLPGLYLIELDARGDRSFHYWRSQSAAKLWMARLEADGGAERLAGVDLVFLSGISLAILSPEDRGRALSMMAALKGRVGRLAFDPNIRPSLWIGAQDARESLQAACALADVVLASQVDGDWIWGEPDPDRQLDIIRRLGCPEVVVTLGEGGVQLSHEGAAFSAPTRASEVIDTSGAGDSFNAAYLAARLRGAPPGEAAAAGQDLAARVVAHPGALIPAHLSHPSTPQPGSPP